MAATKRELSGFFLSQAKFQEHVAALTAPNCAITHLRLFHNEPEHTTPVLQALASNSSVTSFDCYEVDPQSAHLMSSYLAAVPQLQTLVVQHMQSTAVVSTVAQGLASNRSLTELNFTQLDGSGVTALAQAVASWQPARLSQARLHRCNMAAAPAGSLATAALAHKDTLHSLELTECEMADEAGVTLFSAPCPSLLQLVHLDLSSNLLGPGAAAQLGQYLSDNSCLVKLNLAGNRLKDQGCSALQQGLAKNKSLQYLDLSSNGIADDGARSLSTALQENCSLQSLKLSSNAIGAAGFMALLACLTGRCQLRSLQLDMNTIKGADIPADAEVHVTAPLESLSLGHNMVFDAGVEVLVRTLNGCATFAHLDLQSNGVSDAGVQTLLPFLAAKPGLQTLNLDNNRVHNVGARQLIDAVNSHPTLWCFRADGNKLTDPALRATLTEMSQMLAAKKSRQRQRVKQGRDASDSSGSGSDDGGPGPGGSPPHHRIQSGSMFQQQQQHGSPSHKHKLGDGGGSGDMGNGGRNVQARGPGADGGSSAPMDIVAQEQQQGGQQGGSWGRDEAMSDVAGSHEREVCDMRYMQRNNSAGNPAMHSSPPYQATCYIHASYPNDGGSSNGGPDDKLVRTTSLVSASSLGLLGGNKPRFKPLTAEQQRMFEDF